MKYNNFVWKPFCGVSAIILLVSCASRSQNTQLSDSRFAPVYVTDRARFMLLPAPEMEIAIDGAQQLAGKFGDREFVMNVWVRADGRGIEMAFYNGFGMDMGSFSYSDSGISFQSPVFPPSFKAEYLAADFQFCFYRAQALEAALKKAGLTFELENSGGLTERRRIKNGGKTIIEIEKTANQVQYMNFLRGYSYNLYLWGGGGVIDDKQGNVRPIPRSGQTNNRKR